MNLSSQKISKQTEECKGMAADWARKQKRTSYHRQKSSVKKKFFSVLGGWRNGETMEFSGGLMLGQDGRIQEEGEKKLQ